MGIVLRQVALIALITQPPELARVVAVIEEELREGLDAPKGVAGGRKRTCRCCRGGRSPGHARRGPHRSQSQSPACRDRSSRSPGSGRETSFRSRRPYLATAPLANPPAPNCNRAAMMAAMRRCLVVIVPSLRSSYSPNVANSKTSLRIFLAFSEQLFQKIVIWVWTRKKSLRPADAPTDRSSAGASLGFIRAAGRSAADQRLQMFGIAGALHRDLATAALDLAEIVWPSARRRPRRCSLPGDAAWWCRGSARSTAFAPAARRARSAPASPSSVPRSRRADRPAPGSPCAPPA